MKFIASKKNYEVYQCSILYLYLFSFTLKVTYSYSAGAHSLMPSQIIKLYVTFSYFLVMI